MTKGLLSRVPILGTVLEPCAGDGGILDMLEASPLVTHVYGNDIDPLQEWEYQLDATSMEVFDACTPDWVVTNPPYDKDLLPDIIKNSLMSARVGVSMLLRLSFLEPTLERGGVDPWLCDNPPDCTIVTPRYSFTRNRKTDSVTTAWFTWYNLVNAPTIWPRGIHIMRRSEVDKDEP